MYFDSSIRFNHEIVYAVVSLNMHMPSNSNKSLILFNFMNEARHN